MELKLKLRVFITSLLRWNRVVNLTLQRLYSREERMDLDRWPCGPQGRCGRCVEVKSTLPLPIIKPRLFISWPVILLPQLYRQIKSSYIINICHSIHLKYRRYFFNFQNSRAAFLKLWFADHKWSSGSALVVLLDWTLVQKRQKKIKLTWIAYHTL